MRIIDNDGKTKRIMQYSSFGDLSEFGKETDIKRTPLSFTGYEYEDNLNLMYAQARYYLPKIGRFAEEDSNKGNGYLPESLNYYMYCYNSPLCYVDVNGNEAKENNPIELIAYINKKQNSKIYMNNTTYYTEAIIEYDKYQKLAKISIRYKKNNNYLPNIRTLKFKKDEYYVNEEYFDGQFYRNRIYSLPIPIAINEGKMLVTENELTYIFSCDKNSKVKVDYNYLPYASFHDNVILGDYPELDDGITPLRFIGEGNNYIFLDNPEEINLSGNNHIFYLWGSSLSTSFKDVEMYNHLVGHGKIRYGVAIFNANDFPIRITYKKIDAKTDNYDSGNIFMEDIVKSLVEFLTNEEKIWDIAAKSISILNFSFESSIEKFKTIYYRGKFKSSKPNNVWLRAFIFGDTKVSDLSKSKNELFNLKNMYENGIKGFFTGEINYTIRKPTVNLITSKKYHFAEHPMCNYNFDEYTIQSSFKVPGSKYIPANYGITYVFTISNSSGKTMIIAPDKTIDNDGNLIRTHAGFVFRVNNGQWQYSYKAENLKAKGAEKIGLFPFGIYLGNENLAKVEIIVVSGNCGNFTISFK